VFTAKGPPDWTMRSLSDGCLRLTGYSNADLTTDAGQISYNHITHPDDLPRVLSTIQQALSAEQFYEVEYRLITRNGDIKWVWEKGQGTFDRHGNPIGLEGFVTDISTLKQAETALRESETRYRMLAERSLDLISQHDLSGTFNTCPPAVSNLLGYAAAELIGQIANVAGASARSSARHSLLPQIFMLSKHSSPCGFACGIATAHIAGLKPLAA
jgi:PAS domain S-box-containing protein